LPPSSSLAGPSSQSSLADRSTYTNPPSSRSSAAYSYQRSASQAVGEDDELEVIDLTQQDDEPARELYGTIGTFVVLFSALASELTAPQTTRSSAFDTTAVMRRRGRRSSAGGMRRIL